MSPPKMQCLESTYRTIVEAMKDLVYICSPDQRILYINPAMEKHLGHDATGEICYQALYGGKDKCPHCVFDRVRCGETVTYQLDDPRSQKRFSISNAPIVNKDNSISKLTIFHDITLIQELQAQFIQSQRMETLGTLAGGIAHDFNNILTIINGNTDLALMEDVEPGSDLHEQLSQIEQAGLRAADLVRQLLTFSRKQVVKPIILNLDDTLENTRKMLKRIIGEDIELNIIPSAEEVPMVEIDPGQIEQVIMNLAVNAKHAMPLGGCLTFETGQAYLDELYFSDHAVEPQKGTYAVLVVSDTGTGMDKETAKRIFEPFFTTKGPGEGTGLGLSTVYGIMKQNNGFIWVYSEPGLGTTFKIYLPKIRGKATISSKSVIVESAHPRGNETLLIVEDDENLRSVCARMLGEFGYQVLEARNGTSALQLLQEDAHKVDLMISDVIMPVMGGGELAQAVNTRYPDIKIIFMSGYTDNAIAQHGVLKPGVNFLEKPFTPRGLAKMVRKVLQN